MSASMFWQQLLLLLFFNVARTQSSYLNCSIDTRYPLRFVGFFPCLNQWDEEGDCDRLTLTAVKRAIAEINQDTNILRCFKIEMLPITVKDPVVGDANGTDCTDNEMKEAIESTLFVDMQLSTLADINYEERNTTLGILNNNGSLTETDFYSLLHSKVFYAYDAARILALTWNVTIDNYTTEELHNFLNQSWKISNSNQSKTLVQKLQQNLFNVVSPYTGLAGSYDFDKNQGKQGSAIVTQFTGGKECIIGYYDSTNSTNLQECDTEFCCNVTWKGCNQPMDGLCPNGSCTCRQPFDSSIMTSYISITVLLSIGVVISMLLQIYNYHLRNNKYFKGSSPILNAIITFGCTLGYANGYLFLANYYIGMTGNGNLKPICNVTVSLFWLSQLLINSTILMKNWRIFRIFHNPSQKNRNNLSNVKLFLGIGVTSAPVIVALTGSYDFDKNQGKLGSSIVTQFTGGKECIIGYYDSTNSTNLQECDTEFCCNVTWKGCNQPMDGLCPNGSCTCRQPFDSSIMTSYISITVLLSIGVVISMLLQIYNYHLRNNKYFKGSSPILNAIITFGCTLGYANGYLFLANYYIGMTGNGNLKPICNVTVSLFWLSQLLINSTILMKNWRIFRIFHNPSQKNRNNLSNVKLFLGIGVTSAPVIVALTVIQLIKPLEVHQASFKNYHCPGFPDNIEASLVEDHCIVSLTLRWDALILFYIIFLLIIIIFLGSFNCRIPGHFKNEGELAILAGAMTLLLFIVYMAITLVLSNGNPESIMIKDQLAYAGGFVLAYNSFILFALYGSKAILLFRDKKVKPVKRKSTIRRKFSDLHDEIFTLKRQLEKMDASRPIKQLNSSSNLIPNFTFED
ncbi:PREDICTED: uncharacterized protein LOC109584583 [Amphimedon queenslandica]|uniref:G-protein coupled receptors family 3 profile domain-containing protein n=1 Tax=Amphimedon queenslandica TaxID=400682 RepID=A0AAN0JGK2_AMPQE|nr:PREDICTED: uncharacterized protein LOC109584583 [Amphimedon queenslandica]|eukprot:XP_019855931.1 PREDICTED: uncharacterized protein LOC109584583 [Amphimedon queenslandica]